MKRTRHLPSLRQLRVFEAVARHKSIGRAAASTSLSQPAVTQAIASLEGRFGVALFERVRSGSYPTDFGNILLARTERLFDFLRQGFRRLLGSHQSSEPTGIDTLTGKITATHIRCLIAVSENMSFDQAARSIGVSQPSLHRAARELERILRRAIYYRGARGITTNEQGMELARQFKIAMRELEYASDEIAARQGIVTSRIAIGTLATSGSFGLARAIDEFLAQARGAEVHIVEEPYEQLLADLRAGDIDVLFSVLRRPDWATDVTETMLFEEPYVIVMRPKHPLSAVADIGREELAVYDWLVPGLLGVRTLVRFRQETPDRPCFDSITRTPPFAHHHQRPADLADEARGASRGKARRVKDCTDQTSPSAPHLWHGDARELAPHRFTANLPGHPHPQRPEDGAHRSTTEHDTLINGQTCSASMLSRVQEAGKSLERGIGDVMLDAFGVGLCRLRGYPERDQHVDHEPVASTHPSRQLMTALGQEHAAIGAGGGDALALEPRDHLDGGGVGYPEPAGDVGGARFAGAGEEIRDQLDIVLDQRRRLRRARLAEPARLGELGRKLRVLGGGGSGRLRGHGCFLEPPVRGRPDCSGRPGRNRPAGARAT
jgi:DNA-binding transcriptional LysR family regulator